MLLLRPVEFILRNGQIALLRRRCDRGKTNLAQRPLATPRNFLTTSFRIVPTEDQEPWPKNHPRTRAKTDAESPSAVPTTIRTTRKPQTLRIPPPMWPVFRIVPTKNLELWLKNHQARAKTDAESPSAVPTTIQTTRRPRPVRSPPPVWPGRERPLPWKERWRAPMAAQLGTITTNSRSPRSEAMQSRGPLRRRDLGNVVAYGRTLLGKTSIATRGQRERWKGSTGEHAWLTAQGTEEFHQSLLLT